MGYSTSSCFFDGCVSSLYLSIFFVFEFVVLFCPCVQGFLGVRLCFFDCFDIMSKFLGKMYLDVLKKRFRKVAVCNF